MTRGPQPARLRREERGYGRTDAGRRRTGRRGRPDEIAPSYAFLASGEAACITGQVLPTNGGTIVNG